MPVKKSAWSLQMRWKEVSLAAAMAVVVEEPVHQREMKMRSNLTAPVRQMSSNQKPRV